MKFYSHLAPSTPSKFAVHTALCIAIETFLLMTTETSFPTLDKESPLPSETAFLLQAVRTISSSLPLRRSPAPIFCFLLKSFLVCVFCCFCSFIKAFFLFISTHSQSTLLFLGNLTIIRTYQTGIHPYLQTQRVHTGNVCFRNLFWQHMFGASCSCPALLFIKLMEQLK